MLLVEIWHFFIILFMLGGLWLLFAAILNKQAVDNLILLEEVWFLCFVYFIVEHEVLQLRLGHKTLVPNLLHNFLCMTLETVGEESLGRLPGSPNFIPLSVLLHPLRPGILIFTGFIQLLDGLIDGFHDLVHQ
jgi:hypothetical protein